MLVQTLALLLPRAAQLLALELLVIELLFDDAAEDWLSMGLWHGPLYRFDDRAIRLMGKLRKAYTGRIPKQREKAGKFRKAANRPNVWHPPVDPP